MSGYLPYSNTRFDVLSLRMHPFVRLWNKPLGQQAKNAAPCRRKGCIVKFRMSTSVSYRERQHLNPINASPKASFSLWKSETVSLFGKTKREMVSETYFQNFTRSARYPLTCSMGSLICFIVSRSRMVTQWSAGVFSSPTVSKSKVMQNGVPISSSRR